MVTKMKTMGLLVAAILIVSMPMAFADGLFGGKKENPTAQGVTIKDKIFQALNLSDDQKKQMEDVRTKERDAIKPILEQMKSNQEALKQELMNANSDMNKVNGAQSQIKALQGQLEDSHLSSLLEIKKILTPEQFNKFLSMRIERKEKKMQAKK